MTDTPGGRAESWIATVPASAVGAKGLGAETFAGALARLHGAASAFVTALRSNFLARNHFAMRSVSELQE